MNKIVIVGNGFDLAHGLRTSYSDFFKWLLGVITDKHRTSEFLKIDTTGNLKNVISNQDFNQFLTSLKAETDISSEGIYKKLISTRAKDWMDIETVYLDEVLCCRRQQSGYEGDYLAVLNDSFFDLTIFLRDYIASIQRENVINCTSNQKINQTIDALKNDLQKSHLAILNFNYTTTPERYIGHDGFQFRHYNIHGTALGNDEIIFGAGDHYHREYLDLQEENNDELLKPFKFLKYPNQSTYRDFMNFIDSYEFEVHCMGHSLGLTDRSLLKPVFNNKNCKKVYLYCQDNPTEDTIIERFETSVRRLSRHFSQTEQMLKILEPYSRDRVI